MANEKILTSFVVNGEERLIRDTDILHAEDLQPATSTELGGVYPDGETVVFRGGSEHTIYAPASLLDQQIPEDPSKAGKMGCLISYCVVDELPAYGYYNAQYLIANPSLGENMYDLYVGYLGPFLRVVSELPEVGFENVYYLLPDPEAQQQDTKKVYIYTNGAFQDTGEQYTTSQQSTMEWALGTSYSAYMGAVQLNKDFPDISIGDKIYLTYNGTTYSDVFISIEDDVASTSNTSTNPTATNFIGALINLKTGFLTLVAGGPGFPPNEGALSLIVIGTIDVGNLEIERPSGTIKRNQSHTYNLATINKKGGVKVYFNDYTKQLYISSDNNQMAPLKIDYAYHTAFSLTSDINGTAYFDNIVDVNKWIHEYFKNASSSSDKVLKKIKITGKSVTGGTTTYNNIGLFAGMDRLEEIDLSEFDTSNITSMSHMFFNCGANGGIKKFDLSNKFVTDAVEDMSYMFYNTGRPAEDGEKDIMKELNLSHFNTSNVTDMSHAFYASYDSPIHFDDDPQYGFEKIILEGWDTSNVTDLSFTFSNETSEIIGFSSWDTSNVTTMEGTFHRYKYNINIATWDTSKVTTMVGLFDNYGSEVTENFTLDLSNLLTENCLVQNMEGMFYKCYVKTATWPRWERATNLTRIYRMFAGSYFTSITLTGLDTSRVGTMSNLFNGCHELISLTATFNTSSTFEMSYMFAFCSSLSNLNVSFVGGTSGVTNMTYMFYGCSSLASIGLVSTLDTSNVTNMERMFSECSSLIELNLNNFDVSKVRKVTEYNVETKGFVSMFEGDSSLERIYCNNNWYNLATNARPGKDMFKGCTRITNYDPGNPQSLTNAYPGLGGYFTNVV